MSKRLVKWANLFNNETHFYDEKVYIKQTDLQCFSLVHFDVMEN